jgi:hypothetical protein
MGNICTNARFPHSPRIVKRMAYKALCQKIAGQKRRIAPDRQSGRQCRYHDTAMQKPWLITPETLTCSSLYRLSNPAISALPPVSPAFRLSWRLRRKTIQNNVGPPCGTPVDSERFRRAVNVRKKKCADKDRRFDC